MLAFAIGLQLGCGLGLGDGLMPGEGLGLMPGEGLGDGLMPGEGLGLMPGEGLGLGPWASVMVAPVLKKSMPMKTATHWVQRALGTRRACGERLVFGSL
jgi:hypothetical protein